MRPLLRHSSRSFSGNLTLAAAVHFDDAGEPFGRFARMTSLCEQEGGSLQRRPFPFLTALPLARTLANGALIADEAKPSGDKAAAEKAAETPKKFVTHHKIHIGNADLPYTATAEEIFLKDSDGKNTASFFTISYVKDGVVRQEDRPLTFVFNGGPGSASVWLHLGAIGPKVIDIPSDASDPGGPPYRLRDNESTILRAT